mgnify:CR=1 FL=1
MSKKKIALVFGSPTAEYSVSLHSAASALRNFPLDCYECVTIAITKSGRWLAGDFTPEDLDNDRIDAHPGAHEVALSLNPESTGFIDTKTQDFIPVDAALLILHGPYGEGGYVQGLFECAGIPYTGCGVEGSIICMDKELTHIIAKENAIRMAGYTVMHAGDRLVYPEQYPVIVKPCRNGSSYGISIVREAGDLELAVDEAFKYDTKILIESFIKGNEMGCAALLKENELVVSDVDYITLSEQDFFDFNEKYSSDSSVKNICPAPIPDEKRDEVHALTRRLYRLFEMNQFGRFDYFYGSDGLIYLNEVNTIPGFTATSRYPRLMGTVGIDYPTVLKILIEGAHHG